jgi:hypothetical protein
MAALPGMLEHDRTRAAGLVAQAARHLGVSVRAYRELEAGERMPDWDVRPDLQVVRLATDVLGRTLSAQ